MAGDHVTIRSFGSEAEASLAAGRLAQKGIKATFGRISRYKAMAGGGYSLRVPAHQAEKATRILNKLSGDIDMDEYVDADDTSYRRCPACQSVNLAVGPLTSGERTAAILSAGIALAFIKRDRTCKKCGHTWRG